MKKGVVSLVVLGMCWSHLAMALDVRSALYLYAQRGDVRAIRMMQQQGYSLEMMDAHGNTPVCEAALRGDQQTVNVLVSMGANPAPACWNRLPPQIARQMRPQPMVAHVMTGANAEAAAGSSAVYAPVPVNTMPAANPAPAAVMTSKAPVYAPTTVSPPDTFPTGWTALALLGVGGGAIGLFSTLRSGSGSDNKNKQDVTPKEGKTCEGYPFATPPQHADYISCVRDDGVTRFKLIGCEATYIPVWNSSSGRNECVKASCEGYTLVACPNHGICGDPCTEQDGRQLYRLTGCENGYIQSGMSCQEISETKFNDYIGVNGVGNMNFDKPGDTYYYYPKDNEIKLSSAVFQDVYGIHDSGKKQVHNAYVSNNVTLANGRKITITHQGRGNDYGIYSTQVAINTRAVNGTKGTTGTINIEKSERSTTSQGQQIKMPANGNVMGVYGAEVGINIYLLSVNSSTENSRGEITLSKTGSTDNSFLYGVQGGRYATNTLRCGEGNANQVATGIINLSHVGTGSGAVAGVVSRGSTSGWGYAYNVFLGRSSIASHIDGLHPSSAYADDTGKIVGSANGLISITNSGAGNSAVVLGVDGRMRAANGYKDVLSKTANASTGNIIKKINSSDPDDTLYKGAVIEIDNTGDGSVYGVRSTEGEGYNMYNNQGSDSAGRIIIRNNGSLNHEGSVFAVYAKGDAFNGWYYVNERNNASDKNMTNAGRITIGAEDSNGPTAAFTGGGNAIGLYSKTGKASNGYLKTTKDTGSEIEVIENTSIGIYHITPAEVTTTDTIYLRGIEAMSTSFNAEAHIGSVAQSATLNSAIEIRENNKSSTATVIGIGLQTRDSEKNAYNAYYNYVSNSTTVDAIKGAITGHIAINMQHDDDRKNETRAYGIISAHNAHNALADTGVMSGSVSGRIVVRSNKYTVGMSADNVVANAWSKIDSGSNASINGYIEATGRGAIRGLNGGLKQYNAYGKNAVGEINVIKGSELAKSNEDETRHVYGMVSTLATAELINAASSDSEGYINVFSRGGLGNAYGMSGYKVDSGAGRSEITITGISRAVNGEVSGSYIGMHTPSNGYATNRAGDKITINLIGPWYQASGGSTATETPAMTKEGDKSAAYGMWGGVGSHLENAGEIKITREAGSYILNKGTSDATTTTWTPITKDGNKYVYGKAIGMYSQGGGGEVKNSGKIWITGEISDSYGIYVADGTNTTVTNSANAEIHVGANGRGIYIATNGYAGSVNNMGKIIIGHTNPVECEGSACQTQENAIIRTASVGGTESTPSFNQFIYLGGASLNNNGLISSSVPIDFDTEDGNMNIGVGGVYEAPELSGTLGVNTDVVTSGFEDTYTLTDALKADDMSNLHVASKSALFAASNDGSDITMTRKDFQNFTSNNSMAKFLEQNYSLKQNEALFNALKKVGTAAELRRSLAALSGQKMFGRMNFEDLSMMRELNASMNHQLFNHKTEKFSVVQAVQPMNFKGNDGSNIRYSLMNKRVDNKSIGFGMAFTDIASSTDKNTNSRQQTSYQMVVPMGYRTKKMHFMMAPRLGYARSNYDRSGLNNTSYDGVIEKRLYGVANEVRYEVNVGDWKLFPTAEFNVFGYQQKGHERKKQFSLNVPNQNTLSVEGGVGFHAAHETTLAHGTLNLNAGVMAYHEFANPYEMQLRMQGMRGSFTVRDENQSDNRVMFKTGFTYEQEEVSVYGDVMSELRDDFNASVRTGVKVQF